MGLFKSFTCESSHGLNKYRAVYLMLTAALITLGILIETGTVDTPFEEEYWYVSLSILCFVGIYCIIIIRFVDINDYVQGKWRAVAWGTSHFLCYFVLTFLAPKQWPFWLGAGVLWEGFECWTTCRSEDTDCSGFFDIMINTAGVASALAIRMGIFGKGEVLKIK
jgi:hypothetical protein